MNKKKMKKIILEGGASLLCVMLLSTGFSPVLGTLDYEEHSVLDISLESYQLGIADKPNFVKGEFLVKFTDETPALSLQTSPRGYMKTGISSVDVLNERYAVSKMTAISTNIKQDSLVYQCSLSSENDLFSVIQDFENDPHVLYAEPNYVYKTSLIPDDPGFGYQWGLNNIGQTGGTLDADIDAPEAWDIETGDPGVVVALVDTGVDYGHPDLVDNMWINDKEIPGNGLDDDQNGYVDDYYGMNFIGSTDIPLDGKPASYSNYAFWKDADGVLHFRFRSGSDVRFFGSVVTDAPFAYVNPVNISADQYTITDSEISFAVVEPSNEGGFDLQLSGLILSFDLWTGVHWIHGWIYHNGGLCMGSDMIERACPFTYYFGNSPFDDVGHGTHCAGIIAAAGNNGIGVSGTSWGCSVMAVKAFDHDGVGRLNDLVSAIYYAVDNGADVISMSWGGYSFSQALKDATEYAFKHDVVLVAAAGNDNTWQKMYPAAYETVIGVAATDHTDSKAEFSNYGSWVDVAAPGVDIYSTLPRCYVQMFGPGKQYGNSSGTSMACPFVSGVAGLLLSKNQCFSSVEMVRTLVLGTADSVLSPAYIGNGRVNAYTALVRDPAVAYLNPALDDREVKRRINILGSAWGEHFTSYVLEYGKGRNPEEWCEITHSSQLVLDGILGSLNTMQLAEGRYSIRLRVLCVDGEYVDTISVVVHNRINTFIVDDDAGPGYDHTCILDAVDDAGQGDTVYVRAGVYYERYSLALERSIRLVGENKDSTIINGSMMDHEYYVEKAMIVTYADGNSISGFTLMDRSDRDGIWLNSNKNVVKDNNIIHGAGEGIGFAFQSKNIIIGNFIGGTLYLLRSNNNTITNNQVTGGNIAMLLLGSSDNIIQGNKFFSYVPPPPNGINFGVEIIGDADPFGLFGWGSPASRNRFSGNTIVNKTHGLIIANGFGSYPAPAENNLVYHNNFLTNSRHAEDDGVNTRWNIRYPLGGNYWDDHPLFVDEFSGPNQTRPGSDGIVDTPYTLYGGSQDQYPFMKPDGWLNSIPSVANSIS
ncbi:MAG: S8 family serine peptidase [Methanobacteriota archaeon]